MYLGRLFARRLAVLAIGLCFPSLLTAQPQAAAVTAEARPRLVVFIVVDMLRADLLPRYSQDFGEDGFKRLMNRGAYFPNAYYTYGANSTAVGHASLATGRLPRQHGIINNAWFVDPEDPKARPTSFDPDAKVVGLAEGETATGYSARYLLGPTIGDQLKLADRRSRVFSVALKPRAAVMMAGQDPDEVFWWDRSTGKVVTSTWYAESLPAYVAEYNAAGTVDGFIGQIWDRLLPEDAYASCHPVDPAWITYDYNLGKSFPHKLVKADATDTGPGKAYDSIYGSPAGNEIVLEIARRILSAEKLGSGPATDMLCVSFSANDITGHMFGPDSAEMMDITVRTDRQVAQLLQAIDQQVGLDRCAVVLTGDHGVKTFPQLADRVGLGGGHLDVDALTADLNGLLNEEFGQLAEDKAYVAGILPPWLWFHPAVHDLDPDRQLDVLYFTADYLSRTEGIAQVFTAPDLEGASPQPQDAVWWHAWRSYYPGRSGEIYFHLAPHWYEVDADKMTGHGSANSEDRHVPILLSAPGVRPGRYMQNVDPLDIAPTLATILGIQPPLNFAGRVLHEAFGR